MAKLFISKMWMFFVDAARKNALTSKATVAEIEDEIKTWLRGAPDRHGGRAKRAKRKAANRSRRRTVSPSSRAARSRSNSDRSSRRSLLRSRGGPRSTSANRSSRRSASPSSRAAQ